jgi:hypothetical protein
MGKQGQIILREDKLTTKTPRHGEREMRNDERGSDELKSEGLSFIHRSSFRIHHFSSCLCGEFLNMN